MLAITYGYGVKYISNYRLLVAVANKREKCMNQSLNQYYIFYIVAACSNFSAAAKQLYISQPAVSKAVAKLEEELGTPLFYRTTKGVRLTDAGEILFRQLEIAFHAIENGEEQLRRNEALGAGKLSIGVSTTLCKYVLLPYLRQFMKQNPHVKLSISCQSSYETIAALENGSLDIGLVGETDRLEGLAFQPVQSISDGFVCTVQYLNTLLDSSVPPIMGKTDADALLSRGTLLLLDKNNITRQYVDHYILLNRISTGQMIEVSTMDLLIDFAKTGLGIGCVIKDFVEKELKEGSLVLLPTREPIPSRRIGYAYSPKAPVSRSMKRFLCGITASESLPVQH